MNKLEQAARQALQALEDVVGAHRYESGTPVDAIAALREALEGLPKLATDSEDDLRQQRLEI